MPRLGLSLIVLYHQIPPTTVFCSIAAAFCMYVTKRRRKTTFNRFLTVESYLFCDVELLGGIKVNRCLAFLV